MGQNWGRAAALTVLVLCTAIDSRAQAQATEPYDLAKTVVLNGHVMIVAFGSPHCYILIDVKDGAGRSARWAAEAGSLQRVTAAGLSKATIAPGMTVQISGHPRKKDASVRVPSDVPMPVADAVKAGLVISAKEITLPNGKKLAIGS